MKNAKEKIRFLTKKLLKSEVKYRRCFSTCYPDIYGVLEKAKILWYFLNAFIFVLIRFMIFKKSLTFFYMCNGYVNLIVERMLFIVIALLFKNFFAVISFISLLGVFSPIVFADIYSENNIPNNIKQIFEKTVDEPSCFDVIPGLVRKSRLQRIKDLISSYKLNGNRYDFDQDNFNTLGLDIMNFKSPKDFLFYSENAVERMKKHHNGIITPDSYNDKFNFYKKVCSYNKKYVPDIKLVLRGNKIVYPDNVDKNPYQAIREFKNGKYVCKPIFGMCGGGFCILEKKSKDKIDIVDVNGRKFSLKEFLEKIKDTGYIIQDYVNQHDDMKAFNPTSLNTIRIVTMRYHENTHILAAMIRIGGSGSIVDNAHKGGVCVGIDLKTGKLLDYGVTYGKKVSFENKNTGIKYKGCSIPYWNETVNLVKKLHSGVFNKASSLGFDIAITPDGPVAIEVNTGWGTKGLQATNGGLKNRFEKLKTI